MNNYTAIPRSSIESSPQSFQFAAQTWDGPLGPSVSSSLSAPEPEGGGAPVSEPPATNRGVEFFCHWFTATIFNTPVDEVARLICRLLGVEGDLRSFESTGHGARLFKDLRIGPAGAKLYMLPASGDFYVSFELSGEVCQAIGPKLYIELSAFKAAGHRVELSRFDVAFNTADFLPADVWESLQAGQVRTLAKRDKFSQTMGLDRAASHTVNIGSRKSDRFLRVYAHVGDFTRVEMECKDERADLIFWDLAKLPAEQMPARAMAHLLDFVDFVKADWWLSFTAGADRALMTVSNWAVPSVERLIDWLEKQVSASLAVLEEIGSLRSVTDLAERGRAKLKPKHLALIASWQGGASPGAAV